MDQVLFHIAFPVGNLAQTQEFYITGLGCVPGRASAQSLILNLFGHQLVAHVTTEPLVPQAGIYPRHFGLVFRQEPDWEALLHRAQDRRLKFYQAPKLRFKDLVLEHRTFFLEDPFFNVLEFKFYRHPAAIFGAHDFSLVGDREFS